MAEGGREAEEELVDIFSGIPRVTGIPRDGKQNRYESRDWDGTGKKCHREWAGPGIVMIPNFIHKYTFYINKLLTVYFNSELVALSRSPPVCFGVAG